MPRLEGVTLQAYGVRLELLEPRHVEPLRELLAVADRSTFGFTSVPTAESLDRFVSDRLLQVAAGHMVSFVQVDAESDRAVGHTSFCNPRWAGDRLITVEVGHTWLLPGVQSGWINSASKLALFTHAFETWKADRVELRTDSRNERSRAAIQAVGGVFEGILRSSGRSHVVGEEGQTRDTALYALIATTWPASKQRLAARLDAKRTAQPQVPTQL